MNDTTSTTAAPTASSSLADPRLLVPLALFALYVIWGSTYRGIRFALESYPPFLLAGVRFLIAGSLLFGVLRLRGVAMPTRAQWGNAAVTGILLLGFGNGLVCFAEQTVSSGIAAVAVASMPLFAAVFASVYGEHPTRGEIAGLLLGFVGVIVLNLGSGLSGSRMGAIALLTAAAAWAFGSVWSKRRDMPKGPMNTAAQMLCGSAGLLIVGLLHDRASSACHQLRVRQPTGGRAVRRDVRRRAHRPLRFAGHGLDSLRCRLDRHVPCTCQQIGQVK